MSKDNKILIFKNEAENAIASATPFTVPLCARAFDLAKGMLERPTSIEALFSVMDTRDEVDAFSKYLETAEEKNGPLLYGKVVSHFVKEMVEVQKYHDEYKGVMDIVSRCWLYRMSVLFMSEDGSLSKEKLKKAALDRKSAITKQLEQQQQLQQQRQANLQSIAQSPEAIMQLLQNPQTMQLIQQLHQQMADQQNAPPAAGDGMQMG